MGEIKNVGIGKLGFACRTGGSALAASAVNALADIVLKRRSEAQFLSFSSQWPKAA